MRNASATLGHGLEGQDIMSNGRIFLLTVTNFRFQRQAGNFLPAERLPVAVEGFCSTEYVCSANFAE
jgi:hypothetical protein